ncbi:thioredoxin family protein [Mycoplasmopsis felis]|nr:thioredoxin family protein [Mycoplasmopsis felis]UWW00563.1 thioredoxin family protein [Mycoplasmopsis felis]
MFNQMLWKDAEAHINKKQKTQLTFLIFTTEWCGDCKMMLPTFNNIAKKYENQKIEFIQVDAEEAKLFRNPLTKWKVLKTPTMMLLSGDQILEKAYEYVPEEVLSSWIDDRIS